jgi:hypothetical protein
LCEIPLLKPTAGAKTTDNERWSPRHSGRAACIRIERRMDEVMNEQQ